MTTFATSRQRARRLPTGRPFVRGAGARARGFTLPELLIVLVVIGILSVLLLPRIEILKYRMDGSVRGLVTALVMAQRSAVNRQHDVVVRFDTAAGQIRIHEDEDNDGGVDTGERVRFVTLEAGVRFGRGTAPARSGAGHGAVDFSDSQNDLPAVRFHRSGSASSHGSFYLTSERAMAAAEYAKDSRAVEVARATGRASWYYYDAESGWEAGY